VQEPKSRGARPGAKPEVAKALANTLLQAGGAEGHGQVRVAAPVERVVMVIYLVLFEAPAVVARAGWGRRWPSTTWRR
jgi:hypothetical protein